MSAVRVVKPSIYRFALQSRGPRNPEFETWANPHGIGACGFNLTRPDRRRISRKTVVIVVFGMSSLMKRRIFLIGGPCLCCLALSSLGVKADEQDIVADLARSRGLRAQIQQLSKETLLIAARIESVENSQSLLATSIRLESTLSDLRRNLTSIHASGTSQVVKQLERVWSIYENMRPVLLTATSGEELSPDDLRDIAYWNVSLHIEMTKAMKMYEGLVRRPVDKHAKLVSRLSMLTHRAVLECLLIHLGISPEENRLNVGQTAIRFDRTIQNLLTGNADLGIVAMLGAENRDRLSEIRELWRELRPTISQAAEGEVLSDEDLRNLVSRHGELAHATSKLAERYMPK